MTMASDSGKQPGILMAIGHYLDPVWPPAMVASGVASTLIPSGSALSWTFSAAYFAVFFGALACDLFVHMGNLCERCIRAIPLDPQAAIERDRMWLKLFHRTSSQIWVHIRSVRVPVPNKLLALMLLGTAVLTAIRLTFDPGEQALKFVALLTWTTPLASIFWATYRHNRLQPWCPFCPRDDGDDRVEAPEPDPSISS